MKRLPSILSFTATAALIASACASNRPVGHQLDDSVIATKVEAKLAADPEVSPFRVDVDVQEGVVRLSGVVAKPSARQAAADLAAHTQGVRAVHNDLEVGKRPLGKRLSDGAITAKIKAKLAADPEINPFSVDVDTLNGEVTLTGRVADARRRREVAHLARDTKGVVSVRNLLRVGDARDDKGSS